MMGSRFFARPERKPVVLAVEIGNLALRGAIFGLDGVARLRRLRPSGPPGDGVTDRSRALLRELAVDARANGMEPIAIGITSTGAHTPLANILGNELGVPVVVSTSVAARGLAESFAGPPEEQGNTVFVTVGARVRAAIVSGGSLLTGCTDSAGELGHLPVMPDGEWCHCGQQGCLEVYFSSEGLVRRYRAFGGPLTIAGADIARQQNDDPLCGLLWNEGLRALSLGLAALTLLVDPAAIILDGNLPQPVPSFKEAVGSRLADLLAWRTVPAIRVSRLGHGAAQIGAAILAFQAAGHVGIASTWDLAAASRDPAFMRTSDEYDSRNEDE